MMGAESQQPRWLQLLTRIGAAAGAVGAIVALVFLLFPRLKPQEPPQKRGVSLGDVQVSLQRYGDDAVVIFFKIQIDGFQGAHLPVMWTLFDADTGSPVDTWPLLRPPLGSYTVRHPGPILTPTLQSESIAAEVRIPGRPRVDKRTWKVELEIVDGVGSRLARAETEHFSVPEPFAERP